MGPSVHKRMISRVGRHVWSTFGIESTSMHRSMLIVSRLHQSSAATTEPQDLSWLDKSEHQHRADQLHYERMAHVANRILQTKQVNGSGLQEARRALHYFAGNRSRDFVTEEDFGGLLWQVVMEHGSDQSIQHIMSTDDSPGGVLLNLMEQYFFPFRGTSSATKLTTSRRGIQGNKSELLLALKRASDVEKDLQHLQQRGLLKRDEYTCNMTLTLWSHRSLFLADFGSRDLDNHTIQETFGGVSTVQNSLITMQHIIDTFMQGPVGANASDMYNILISAWTNSGLDDRIEKIQELLTRLKTDFSIEADIIACNTILHAYSQKTDTDSECVQKASQHFARMKDIGKVDVVSYSTLILTYAKAGLLQRCEEVLEEMEGSATATGIYPNDICYNTLLDAYSQAGTVKAAQRAEALVEKMTQLSISGVNTLAAPDRVSYTSVIKAWRNSGSRSAAAKAEAILLRCQELSDMNSTSKPDSVMINTVLSVWARVSEFNRGSAIGAQGADHLLSRMKDGTLTPPNTISYNTVMHAWSKSETPNSATRVLELLEEMRSSGQRRCQPDEHTYNAVLNALAKSRDGHAIMLVEKFIEEMRSFGIPPTVIQYNTLMDAIVASNAVDGPTRVEGILRMMEEEFKNGNSDLRPNMHSYNIVMNAYSKSNDPDAPAKIERLQQQIPTHFGSSIMNLTTLVDAHARAGRANAAEKVLRTFLKDPNMNVTTIIFNIVINAHARSDHADSPLHAEALLSEMYAAYEAGNANIKPDAVTFSSVINCWSRSNRIGSAERAEAILNRMTELTMNGHEDLEPTSIAYSTTISAWARSGLDEGPARAKSILDRMEENYKSCQNKAKPSHYCYNAVLNAISKGSSTSKATDAVSMLERMKQAFRDGNHDAKPTNTSYATVLNACAFASGTAEEKLESFQIASRTFRELINTDYCEPNVVVYINFLACCGLLLPRGDYRTKIACQIFRQCYHEGMLHDKVIDGLRRTVAPETYRREMQEMTEYLKQAGHGRDRFYESR